MDHNDMVKIFEIGPTAFESLLIRSFLNSSFELVLYGSISIGSLLIGFALTFGFTERDVLDFRSRFLEPEVVFVSEDRLGLSRDDFLSCTFGEFLQTYFIAYKYLRVQDTPKARFLKSSSTEVNCRVHYKNYNLVKIALMTFSSKIEDPISVPSLFSFFTILKTDSKAKTYSTCLFI